MLNGALLPIGLELRLPLMSEGGEEEKAGELEEEVNLLGNGSNSRGRSGSS